MKTRSFVSVAGICAALLFASAFVLGGCGSGATSGGPSGDTVRVSLAQGTRMPGAALSVAAAVSGSSSPSPSGTIDNAWITVVKVALIPASAVPAGEPTSPDPGGEPAVEDDGMNAEGFVSAAVPPTEIDLMHLPPPPFAWFLNEITNVPAGKYVKIRLYYRNPMVKFSNETDNTAVHATANYHLDIHFVGGGLVIPVRTNPDHVFINNVTIVFVEGGLKITVNPSKVLMRPQVFATVSAVQMGITGTAENVVKTDAFSGSLDIVTAETPPRTFHAEYDGQTAFYFKDSTRSVRVFGTIGPMALKDTATVEAIGSFDSGMVLIADGIKITFPSTLSGPVATGWTADNTFTLNAPPDNIVFVPDRLNAYYDNNAPPYDVLTDNVVVPGAQVTARGYDVGDRLEAYWISIGP